MACTLHGDLCTFVKISHQILLRMRNVSDNICRENQNIHFIFNNFFSENRAVYEKMWKNIVERGRLQFLTRCMRIACWITKVTNTHTHTHTHNVRYLLLFHCNNGHANAPQCYIYKYIAWLNP
jgi:hypothetical protein